jgi:transcriptional regulator with XRE-family HTH domain
MADFAKHFKRVRESRGVALHRLSQLTGLSKQGVYNLEQPGADPKLSTIIKLAEALGVKPWELLPGWDGQSTTIDREEQGEGTPEGDEASQVEESRAQNRQSTRVDRDEQDEGGAEDDEAARADASRARMERREARIRRADARWLRDLERRMQQEETIRGRGEMARRPGESVPDWAARLAKMDLERVHPGTKPELSRLFRENGTPNQFEYKPPPPKPPTPRAAYSGAPDLESFARACEPYLRRALSSVDIITLHWVGMSFRQTLIELDELVLRPSAGKSTAVDSLLAEIAPRIRRMISDLWPRRDRHGYTPPPVGSRDPRAEYVPRLGEVFARLGLEPSGMTAEEEIAFERISQRACFSSKEWAAYLELSTPKRRKRLEE